MNENKKNFSELITESGGWVGIALVLLAYVLVSLGQVKGDSGLFLFLNLFGGLGIAVDALADKNIQPAVLNFIWVAIAVIGLIKLI